MQTLGQLIEVHGVQVDEHLARELAIPVSSGLQRQGDVIVIPRPSWQAATDPVPRDGVAVVSGENDGHTHQLLPSDGVFFDRINEVHREYPIASEFVLDLGALTVAPGSTAVLAHPEHGYMLVGPGTFLVRRQRELTGQVAD